MVWSCCICKISHGEIENVSFHSIPKTEEQRLKWLTIINKKIGKSSSVCSRHFKEDDFNYKVVGSKIKRFLKTGVVPSLLFIDNSDRSQKENFNDVTSPEPCLSNESYDEQCLPTSPTSESCYINIKKENINDLVTAAERDDLLPHACLDSYDTTNISSICEHPTNNQIMDAPLQREILKLKVNSSNEKNLNDNEEISLKRKNNKPLTGPKRFSNPRFIGDLRRDDFTSNASFSIVQKYVKETHRKTKLMNRHVNQMSNKLKNMKEMLIHLKNEGILSADAFDALQVIVKRTLQQRGSLKLL